MNDGIISKLTVSNFQSHRNTVINLKQGVNAFVGLSDAGKSAIFRAAIMVLTNKGLDKSHWGGVTDVEMTFSDGPMVSRVTDKKNKYFVLTDTIDEEYEAFGRDKSEPMPKDVVEVLNMDDINIARQMDLPFLLNENGGEVARMLNRCCNLSVIDTTISNIRKVALANSDDVKSAKALVEKLETQLASFTYIKDMEVAVNALESQIDRASHINNASTTLRSIIGELETAQGDLEDINYIITAEQPLQAVFDKIAAYDRLEESEKVLRRLVAVIQINQQKSDEQKAFLQAEAGCTEALGLVEEAKGLEGGISELYALICQIEDDQEGREAQEGLLTAEPEVIRGIKLIEKSNQYTWYIMNLKALITETNQGIDASQSSDGYIETLEQEFGELMKDGCPVCGGTYAYR